MIYACEKVSECLAEWRVLGDAHWTEFYGDTDFDPDIETMTRQEREGAFVYFSMRNHEGELCGQAAFTVSNNPIFRALVAYDSFFYIAPEHRNKNNMKKLLNFAGQYLKSQGVEQIFAGHHLEHDLSSLLKGANFAPTSMLYLFKGVE